MKKKIAQSIVHRGATGTVVRFRHAEFISASLKTLKQVQGDVKWGVQGDGKEDFAEKKAATLGFFELKPLRMTEKKSRHSERMRRVHNSCFYGFFGRLRLPLNDDSPHTSC